MLLAIFAYNVVHAYTLLVIPTTQLVSMLTIVTAHFSRPKHSLELQLKLYENLTTTHANSELQPVRSWQASQGSFYTTVSLPLRSKLIRNEALIMNTVKQKEK